MIARKNGDSPTMVATNVKIKMVNDSIQLIEGMIINHPFEIQSIIILHLCSYTFGQLGSQPFL